MGLLVKPRGRRKQPKYGIDPNAPQPLNRREDAAVEAKLAAAGVDISLKPPDGLCFADKQRESAEQMIGSDPSLATRPAVRRLLLELCTRKLENLDGTPVKDKLGNELPGTAWDAVVRSEILRAVNGDERAREFVWQTIFGKPREAMELSGPGGGPIRSVVETESLSPEEMAKRFVRAARIAQEIMAAEVEPPKAIDAIEVGAQTTVPTAPLAPGQVAIEAVPAPVLSSVPMPAVQPTAPQVGSIPRK